MVRTSKHHEEAWWKLRVLIFSFFSSLTWSLQFGVAKKMRHISRSTFQRKANTPQTFHGSFPLSILGSSQKAPARAHQAGGTGTVLCSLFFPNLLFFWVKKWYSFFGVEETYRHFAGSRPHLAFFWPYYPKAARRAASCCLAFDPNCRVFFPAYG